MPEVPHFLFQLPRIAKPSGTAHCPIGNGAQLLFQLPRIAKPSGTGLTPLLTTAELQVSTSPDSKAIRNTRLSLAAVPVVR